MSTYTIRKVSAGYMPFIELKPSDVKRLTKNGNKRVICNINNKVTIHAAIMKSKEGFYYIMVAGKYLSSLNVKVNDKVQCTFEVDMTALQFDVPEEFSEVFDTDEEAKSIFDGLTDGRKRGLIALVNMVKSSQKKIDRALLIAEKLKAGIYSPQQMLKK